MEGISVVIPNYNGRKLLEQVLPPLVRALLCSGKQYEIIVSDDCSTDDSVVFLEISYPSIRVLRSDQNKGFSPTINKGIFIALYDHVLLLNSDVKLEEDYFDSLFPYFDVEDTFGVMGRIIDWEGEGIQDGAKYPYFHLSKIKTGGNYISLHPQKDERLYSMYLSGANALVCRKKLMELGGFNEMYAPFYVEDYELSLRAWRLGYKCYYDHYAICRHKQSVTIKSTSRKDLIKTIHYRNKMYLHATHLGGIKLCAWYIQSFLEAIAQAFVFRFYYFKALWLFYKNHSSVKEARKKLSTVAAAKKRRLLPVQAIVHIILHSLKGKEIKKF